MKKKYFTTIFILSLSLFYIAEAQNGTQGNGL